MQDLIGIAVLLALLPLERATSFGSFTGDAWNAGDLLLWLPIMVVFGSRGYAFVKEQRKALLLSSILILIGSISLASNLDSAKPDLYLRLAAILLLIPVFVQALKKYSVHTLTFAVILIATLHGLWGILQFSAQNSFGLEVIGGPPIDQRTPGIAKFSLWHLDEEEKNGVTKIVRSHGPYAHPNVIAGSISIALSLACLVLIRTQRSSAKSFSLLLCIYFLVLALILTFTRAAYLSTVLIVGSGVVISQIKGRSMTLKLSRSHSIRSLAASIAITLIVFTPLFVSRALDKEDQAIGDRVLGYQTAYQLVQTRLPLWGYGLGNYPLVLQQHLDEQAVPYKPWHIAPLHNAPLLLLFELGLIPLAGLTAIGGYYFYRYGNRYHLFLIALAPLFLTDHYWLTHPAPLVQLVLLLLVLHYWGRAQSPHLSSVPSPVTALK